MHTIHSLPIAVCALVVICKISAFAQGPLAPPSAPTPSMKSLDQIDSHVDSAAGSKRIPIGALNTPGDSTNVYLISQPGAYYLTGNINGVSSKNGLGINSDNVSVDLNG